MTLPMLPAEGRPSDFEMARLRASYAMSWSSSRSMYADPNPFPYFHLFGRRKPAQPPRCTGDPCVCTNGIGCVTIPMELW